MARQPLLGQGPLMVQATQPHSDTPHSIEFLCTGNQPNSETSTWQHTTLKRDRGSMPPPWIEPSIPACERPQTHALGHAATGIGC